MVRVAFRGGTPMCGRWGCVPADHHGVVARGHAVNCGGYTLLCTPVVAAGGVAQLAVGDRWGCVRSNSDDEWRQSRVVSRVVEK